MAKKRTSKCTHKHALALQQELDELRSVQGPGFQFLLGYEPFKQLAVLLAKAHFESVVSNGSSMALASGRAKLGPEDSDGIILLGEHIALPRYAVPQRLQSGVLADTLKAIRACVRDVEGEMDWNRPRKVDTSVRCGLSACEGRNRRQRPDAKYCAWCARPFGVEEEMSA